MGLDVTAYSGLQFIESMDDIEAFEEKYWTGSELTATYVSKYDGGFPEHLGSLIKGSVYSFKNEYDFRAGSYSGYNYWRDLLSRAALKVPAQTVWKNPDQFRDLPFYWLVNFSDCEGYIGPEKCAILLKNFTELRATVEASLPASDTAWPPDEFMTRYDMWMTALQLAADGGMLMFS